MKCKRADPERQREKQRARTLGDSLLRARLRHGLSRHCMAKLARAMHEANRAKGLAPVQFGLSRSTIAKRERLLQAQAWRLQQNVMQVTAFLLRRVPRVAFTPPSKLEKWPITSLLSMDGYTPRNSLRTRNARFRMAVCLQAGAYGTSPLTIIDVPKSAFKGIDLGTLLAASQQTVYRLEQDGGIVFRIPINRVGGDHAELWVLFKGMGGRGHRSAFCCTRSEDWLSTLHSCKRCSIQELSAHFHCPLAAHLHTPAYTVTPPPPRHQGHHHHAPSCPLGRTIRHKGCPRGGFVTERDHLSVPNNVGAAA